MQNLEIINQSLLSKQGIQDAATAITSALDNGEVNPLDLRLAFKAVDSLGEKIKKKLDECTLEEGSKYPKTFEYKGGEFTQMEAGTKYDYSECGSMEWAILTSHIEDLTKKRKLVEEELKALKGKRIVVNEETGEVTELFPPKKTSTTTYKLTFK